MSPLFSTKARLHPLLLAVPLVAFIGVTFVAPLFTMMSRSVHDPTVADTLPRTVALLRDWDRGAGLPPEAVYAQAAEELLNRPQRAHHRSSGDPPEPADVRRPQHREPHRTEAGPGCQGA